LKSDWLLDMADEAVRITDGMGNLVNLHALATLEAESALAKILYKGFLGDAMMGFGLRHQLWSNYNDQITTAAHLQVHRDQGVITFDPERDHKDLFTEAFQNEIHTAVIDNYISGMKDAETPVLADQRIYFDFYQRVPRMTIKGIEVARHRTMVRLPFADKELVEFSLTIPPGLRYQRRLLKNAVIRAFPKLAQIPITETGLPMMFCGREVLFQANRLIRWHLHHSGLKWISPDLRRPYQDYNNWFRTILRPWIENILLSDRSLQRGYYNPEYIRTLITEHMAGADNTVRIGALMSIELWHRQFID
jgi:asparagine synthase (glutamine-hydrolysing)